MNFGSESRGGLGCNRGFRFSFQSAAVQKRRAIKVTPFPNPEWRLFWTGLRDPPFLLARCAWDTLRTTFRAAFGRCDAQAAGIRTRTPACSNAGTSLRNRRASWGGPPQGVENIPPSTICRSQGQCSAARWTGSSKESRRSFLAAPEYAFRAWPRGRCWAFLSRKGDRCRWRERQRPPVRPDGFRLVW